MGWDTEGELWEWGTEGVEQNVSQNRRAGAAGGSHMAQGGSREQEGGTRTRVRDGVAAEEGTRR